MNKIDNHKTDLKNLIEKITATVLYEGYSLFPYHRSAIKNQKPIPIGVIYPGDYHKYSGHASACMQTECIAIGNASSSLHISLRFLSLKPVTIFEKNIDGDFERVAELTIGDRLYQTGWQTIERNIDTEELLIYELCKSPKIVSFTFIEESGEEILYDGYGKAAGKKSFLISETNGSVTIFASQIAGEKKGFKLQIIVKNETPVAGADKLSREDISVQSFLSTNTILSLQQGEFISQQNPPKEWGEEAEKCTNINTWPILIDKQNSTILSSPIILYDHPVINPKSKVDLFDSLEIEEALMLHFAAMSDDEKKRIAESDEKLESMLKKVGDLTPESMLNLHGGFTAVTEEKLTNKNNV